jgi:predicted unusual protein kinase regulating ubiquinone biosynthesis (AarF/ABC1/UbiB family)
VLWQLAPFVVDFLRDRRRWVLFGRSRRLPVEAHRARARKMVDTIVRLGPAFIKLIQVFSSRADIVPEPYLSEFSRLHDAVAPVPPEQIEEIILQEMGRPVHEVFESFEREPIAAAALGPVQRARADGPASKR